ncbi:hypothetical protein lbkm_1072 [Lachnospiraceae bacterium KM106-2]|nr:hypothetical protein lbkm_1072 [Lachnospiraceae bacterium KM106-2]
MRTHVEGRYHFVIAFDAESLASQTLFYCISCFCRGRVLYCKEYYVIYIRIMADKRGRNHMKNKYLVVVGIIICVLLCSCKNTSNKTSKKQEVGYYLTMDDSEWNKYDTTYCGYSSKKKFLQQGETYIKEMEKITGLHNWEERYSPEKKNLEIKVVLQDDTASHARTLGKTKGITLKSYYFRYGVSPYAHELAHIFAGLGNNESLSEGFPCYLSDQVGCVGVHNFGINPHKLATMYIKEKRYQEVLDAIGIAGPPENASPTSTEGNYRSAYYNCSDSFCTYLIEKYGIHKFLKLYQSDQGLDAYQKVYGKTVVTLKADWSAYIKNYPVQFTKKEVNQQIRKVLIKYHYPLSSK